LGLVRVSDKELVQRVAGGDCDAFNLLVGRWEKKLFNLAYRLVGNREDAFDICQDTFIRAYEQMHQLKDPGKFAQWLFQIARNLCISHHRSSKPASQHLVIGAESEEMDLEALLSDGSPISLDGGERFQPSELRLIVERALSYLPMEQKETVVLKIYEGLKFSEIAEITETPVSTVKSRLYLGLSQLKKILTNTWRSAP
jgi:RNA polymerase sigma-70 factor (ECF subfamily)